MNSKNKLRGLAFASALLLMLFSGCKADLISGSGESALTPVISAKTVTDLSATTDGKDNGIWLNEPVVERTYTGDVLLNTRKYESSQTANDELNVNVRISIFADAYAYDHFFAIKYVEWMGALWKVTNVEVQRPRLILTLGGVYNGDQGSGSAE